MDFLVPKERTFFSFCFVSALALKSDTRVETISKTTVSESLTKFVITEEEKKEIDEANFTVLHCH